MRRLVLIFLALALAGWAANLKLYLKDGSFQIVREYQVETDRVRFYSVERSQWEEIPLDLVDVKRTQDEASARQAEISKETKMISEEDKVERQLQQEVLKIPQNPGVYWLEGNDAKILHAAESTLHTNKGRSVLKRLAPIPVVSGKATLELMNAHSMNIFTNREQEFYIQLSQMERFGIIKLQPKLAVRIVEKVTFMPVTNEVEEEPETIETFQKQMTPDGLYKIWPENPLPDGEYAVVEYTAGQLNMQVFDFAVKGGK